MAFEVSPAHPLRRLFQGLTEYTFQVELGIAEPEVVSYVADLLVRFVPASSLWKIRDPAGERVQDVEAMVAEAESSPDENRRRECHRHVGDFTLFWTGVYPEAVTRLRISRTGDGLIDFQQQGKRSYLLASVGANAEGTVLRRLAEEFERCAFGLSRVRKEWESHGPERSGGPYLLV